MMEKKARRRIHVSNIPYELKKEDIIALFETVGPVLDCEQIFDKTTNKPKGSAKIEYPDYFTAKSALRNLNRFEIKGRLLKINFANSDKFAQDLNQVIPEDDFSDPEEFEQKNVDKDFEDIIHGLPNNQKFFLLLELKGLCDGNEEEFKKMLLQDEKTAQLILKMQRDLNLDRLPKQMTHQDIANRRFQEPQIQKNWNYGMNPSQYMNQMYIGGGQMTTEVPVIDQQTTRGVHQQSKMQLGKQVYNYQNQPQHFPSQTQQYRTQYGQNQQFYNQVRVADTGNMQQLQEFDQPGQSFDPQSGLQNFGANQNMMYYNQGTQRRY